jgi:hypothetical protein
MELLTKYQLPPGRPDLTLAGADQVIVTGHSSA